jgi:hypothetical protein
MKKIIILIAMFSLVGVNACQKEGSYPTDGSVPEIFNSNETNLPDYNNSSSDLVEGTFAQEIALIPPYSIFGGELGRGPGTNDPRNPVLRFDPLGKILNSLALSTDQVTAIKFLLSRHIDCVKAAMLALRESEKPIIDDARAKQKAIMEQVKNATLTREAAKTKLKALNDETRKALTQNPARLPACNAMKECLKDLFTSVRETLNTQDQLNKWDAWVAKQPKIDCTTSSAGTGG